MIKVKFSEKEKELLDRFNIPYADSMDSDMAERVLNIADQYQSLSDEDQYVADSIIDKITTHPDW
jgi:hypothetical protein